jgi:citrate synthase
LVNVDDINRWVTSDEACQRLGIRSQTLYAYVSRGRLTRRREGRRSLFSVDELDRLAAKGRRGTRQARLEVLIDTEVTLLDPAGRLLYRGVDVASIVGRWSYERAAEWLWAGVDHGEPAPWVAPPRWALLAGVAVGALPADRLRVAVAAIATEPGELSDAEAGRALVPALLEALPVVGSAPPLTSSVAARLWPRLTALAPTPARVAVLGAALVLLADHEMAVSTVAVRVASSSQASPVGCVLAGLATHAGTKHGGSTRRLQRAIAAGEPVPGGFGHAVYTVEDPRATLLFDVLEPVAPPARWRSVEAARAQGERANVDLALGAMAVCLDMVDGAAEAVFALARIAGWLAHAAEERDRPFRFRPRASYVGPPPV